jgi:hypothetical protein
MAQIDNHVEGIMGPISLGNPRQPNNIEITLDDVKEIILAKERKYFRLSRKNLYYLHFKDFLKYKFELYLKQPLTPPQRNIIVVCRTLNYKLAI